MDDSNEDISFAGVPTTPEDLYKLLLFFLALYLVGDCFCSKALKIVPSLVGYILVGIALGPEGLGLLGSANNESCGALETLVVLGNLGLVLLIVQAGLEIDYETLRLVGPRGVIIAVMGSIFPVAIGTGIAFRYVEENDWRSALAAGCSFGPTSAGIAMNVLGQCKVLDDAPSSRKDEDDNGGGTSEEETILHLPVGQLIVAAAIVDDILALVVLSQLQALTNEASDDALSNKALDIAVPIVSAFLWLFGGGAIALWIFPKVLAQVMPKVDCWKQPKRGSNKSLVFLLGLVYLLLLGTYYSRASYLLGAFLSGLAFCRDSSGVDKLFREQFEKPLDYLMKLFFAASIGFQVPVRSFGDISIIGRGFLFALALTGKFAVGLLAPNFYGNSNVDDTSQSSKQYRGKHLRDCVVVGFSMMGEAEFAFVVALFGVSEGLVPPDINASIVFAILLSTVISPLLLKSTLGFFPYRKKITSSNQTSSEGINGESRI